MNTNTSRGAGIASGGKKGSIIFLQLVLVLIGIGVLALLLWEPHVEGRNAHTTLFAMYFKDPFLAYIYIAFITFFVALYKAYRILGYVRQNKSFSEATIQAFRTIRYCALIFIAFIVGAEAYFFIVMRGKDDIAGGVVIGLVLIFTSVVTATAAALFERLLQNAVDIKSENDLTV
jgi:hypothetical protein